MKVLFVLFILFTSSCIIAEGIYKQIHIQESTGTYVFEDALLADSNDTSKYIMLILEKNGTLKFSKFIPNFGTVGKWSVLPSDTGFFIEFEIENKIYGSSNVCCNNNRIDIYTLDKKNYSFFKIK